MKLRIKFAKTGVMRFIGHLDILRYFQKAIRRAGMDIAYSEGFSPHQIMSFAAPLGVGLESYGEYMDIEVHSCSTSEEMKTALNQVMAEGMQVLSVTMLPEGAGNAMASVAAASYQIAFRSGYAPDFAWMEQLAVFYEQDRIPYWKQSKKERKGKKKKPDAAGQGAGLIEVDLKTGIYSLSVDPDGIIRLMVNASSSGNIKPGMVIEAFLSMHGKLLPEHALSITRMEMFTNAGTEECPEWIPLEAVGRIF